MIEVKKCVKYYDKFKAVDNVSFTVNSGRIVGFLGPNGAGKTTTIKMITGILNLDGGEILINGVDIDKNPTEAKEQIGFVSDDNDVFLRLKGIEYINFMADMYDVPAKNRMEKIQEYSELFDMQKSLGDKIASYSHGMRQKITIIATLVTDPSVWILDEPMTGLDPNSFAKLKQLMRNRANEGKTVFFSTHVLDVAEKICDDIIIIKQGSIVFNGTLEKLLKSRGEDSSLEDLFLEITE